MLSNSQNETIQPPGLGTAKSSVFAVSTRLASSRPSEILIVGEDRPLAQQLLSFLSSRDCQARAVRFSDDLLVLVERRQWDLILLDIESSPGDGLDRLRRIRAISDAPILVTGRHLTSADRIVVLELGADGYVAKPFDLHEFWAHARAIQRREDLGRYQISKRRERAAYRFDGWILRVSDRRLLDPAGCPASLSRSTYTLLTAFLDAPGRALSRAFLLRAAQREDTSDWSIDVQVLRLRRTLERDGARKPLIRTEPRIGYMFDAVVERVHQPAS
jgi:two-component system, OmpR family, response regulator